MFKHYSDGNSKHVETNPGKNRDRNVSKIKD